MALFKNNSKKDEAQKESDEKKQDSTSKKTEKTDLSWVIKGPRVTEKAALISSDNAYSFNVALKANKIQIKQAIIEQYKVTPLKVNIVNRKAHKETKRGRTIHVKAEKKAMVYLKEGDSIELV